MNTPLYQFNFDFKTQYIQGYIISADDMYIEVEVKHINILGHNIHSSNNIIKLSKNVIVCYFQV